MTRLLASVLGALILVTGVSARRELHERAVELGAELVLVHHGLFWKFHPTGLTPLLAERLRPLFKHDINLVAYHLPLDAHPELGNNALLARALEWMATDRRCANQAFNVVNGDAPRWRELWARFAAALGIEAGAPQNTRLAQYMADKARIWDAVVARHGLQARVLDRIALWDYGDYVFRPEWDIISSMNKARRCGFEERVDTHQMFERVFAGYREQRITS